MNALKLLLLVSSLAAHAQEATVPNPQILIDQTTSPSPEDKHLKSSPLDSIVCQAQQNSVLMTNLLNQINQLRSPFQSHFLMPQFPVVPKLNLPPLQPLSFYPQNIGRAPAVVPEQAAAPATQAAAVPTEVVTSTPK
jgi:hypothetical protein